MIARAIGASDQHRYATVIPPSHGARPGSLPFGAVMMFSVLSIPRVGKTMPAIPRALGRDALKEERDQDGQGRALAMAAKRKCWSGA